MSVLIRGMEMPKNEPLLVKINPDGSVSTTARNGYRKYEAVPVPPHGRLIDADALKSDGFYTFVCYTGKMPYEYTAMLIDDAPTIIPAEEGE